MSESLIAQAFEPDRRGWFYAWPRPLLLWSIIAVLPFALVLPEISEAKFKTLVGAAIFLAIFRGAIDKDGLARILMIWKGSIRHD